MKEWPSVPQTVPILQLVRGQGWSLHHPTATELGWQGSSAWPAPSLFSSSCCSEQEPKFGETIAIQYLLLSELVVELRLPQSLQTLAQEMPPALRKCKSQHCSRERAHSGVPKVHPPRSSSPASYLERVLVLHSRLHGLLQLFQPLLPRFV